MIPAFGSLRLQQFKSLDVERFYAEQTTLAPATLELYHAIISGAVKAALRAGIVTRNVATSVNGKPKRTTDPEAVDLVCWDVDDARKFLAAAKADGHQQGAFYAGALDAGPRKNELCGLKRNDVDPDNGTVTIRRQLGRWARSRSSGHSKTTCRARSSSRRTPWRC